jgi:hypothetical protein
MLQNDSLRALPDGSTDICELIDFVLEFLRQHLMATRNLAADQPAARGNLDASEPGPNDLTINALPQQYLEHERREHEYSGFEEVT